MYPCCIYVLCVCIQKYRSYLSCRYTVARALHFIFCCSSIDKGLPLSPLQPFTLFPCLSVSAQLQFGLAPVLAELNVRSISSILNSKSCKSFLHWSYEVFFFFLESIPLSFQNISSASALKIYSGISKAKISLIQYKWLMSEEVIILCHKKSNSNFRMLLPSDIGSIRQSKSVLWSTGDVSED